MCSFTNGNTKTLLGGNPKNTDLEIFSDANNLIKAFYLAKKDTGWKESVQRFESNLLLNIYHIQKELRDGTYKQEKLREFTLHERGRVRQIRPQSIRDRVIQRSFNDSILEPRITPKLIYDNYASLPNRGTSLARKRFLIHLQKAYKEFGEDAVVIQMDFSKYFDNILHDICKSQLAPYLDKSGMNFVEQTLKNFELDVSYLDDEQFKNIDKLVLNCVELSKLPKELKTGTKIAKKSLGVGFHISQICGVFHPYKLDNYIKIVKGIKYTGRFMDDLFIIVKDKDTARSLIEDIIQICSKLGIIINDKKFSIKKITDWHAFLKINYKILPSGRVIRKIHNSTILRERKHLYTYRKLFDKYKMSFSQIINNFKSWLGTYKRFNNGYKIKSLKILFTTLFKGEYKKWMKEKKFSSRYAI